MIVKLLTVATASIFSELYSQYHRQHLGSFVCTKFPQIDLKHQSVLLKRSSKT